MYMRADFRVRDIHVITNNKYVQFLRKWTAKI